MYDRENLTLEEMRAIEKVPCRGKVIFSDKEWPGLDYVITMKTTDCPMGAQCMDKNWFGIRTFERQFDFVKWLNQ